MSPTCQLLHPKMQGKCFKTIAACLSNIDHRNCHRIFAQSLNATVYRLGCNSMKMKEERKKKKTKHFRSFALFFCISARGVIHKPTYLNQLLSEKCIRIHTVRKRGRAVEIFWCFCFFFHIFLIFHLSVAMERVEKTFYCSMMKDYK